MCVARIADIARVMYMAFGASIAMNIAYSPMISAPTEKGKTVAEYRCKQCGISFRGSNQSHSYDFCSRSCAARYRWDNKQIQEYDQQLQWKCEDGRWVCPYHAHVSCRTRRCTSCGWNPEVERKRNEMLGIRSEEEDG